MRSCLYIFVLLLLSFACSDNSGQQAQRPPVKVKYMEITRADQPVVRQYTGITAGYREVEVRAQVSGILLKRDYQEGDKVTQGQSLFVIDPAPYQADLLRAESALKQTQAVLKNAQLEYNRIIPLYANNAVSQKVRDEAAAALDTAKANENAARAEVSIAKINLGYTKVFAPITGMSSKETVSEGSLVVAGDPSGSLLTRITQYDPVYVHFSPPNSEVFTLQRDLYLKRISMPEEGLEVKIYMPDGKPYMESGRVDFADSMVDPATGTVRMRAIFNNPHNLIFPGQFVKVELSGSNLLNVVVIPQRALLQTEKGSMVWLIDQDNTVKLHGVELGMKIDNYVVVEKGLEQGQKIVVEGINKLAEGVSVSPEPYEAVATVNNGNNARNAPARPADSSQADDNSGK